MLSVVKNFDVLLAFGTLNATRHEMHNTSLFMTNAIAFFF
jgi:hypothetical protein